MKIKYKVEEEDFLDYHLFITSKSGIVEKRKRNFWISLAISILVFGYFIYSDTDEASFNTNFIVRILIIFVIPFMALGFFYPKYIKKQYKKGYHKLVKENYSKVFGETTELEFNEAGLFSKEQNAEARMDLSEIEVINETPNYFFIKLRSGLSLIVPKKGLENSNEVKSEFKRLDLEVEEYLDWKW